MPVHSVTFLRPYVFNQPKPIVLVFISAQSMSDDSASLGLSDDEDDLLDDGSLGDSGDDDF